MQEKLIAELVSNVDNGLTEEELLSVTYRKVQRLMGNDSARILFYYTEGFTEELIAEYGQRQEV